MRIPTPRRFWRLGRSCGTEARPCCTWASQPGAAGIDAAYGDHRQVDQGRGSDAALGRAHPLRAQGAMSRVSVWPRSAAIRLPPLRRQSLWRPTWSGAASTRSAGERWRRVQSWSKKGPRASAAGRTAIGYHRMSRRHRFIPLQASVPFQLGAPQSCCDRRQLFR